MSFYLFRGLNILTKSIYVKNSTFSKLALIHLWHCWRELCMPYVWLQFMCTSYLVDQLRDVQIATNVHYLDTVCRAVYNMSVCHKDMSSPYLLNLLKEFETTQTTTRTTTMMTKIYLKRSLIWPVNLPLGPQMLKPEIASRSRSHFVVNCLISQCQMLWNSWQTTIGGSSLFFFLNIHVVWECFTAALFNDIY